jgi:hypothetical protein
VACLGAAESRRTTAPAPAPALAAPYPISAQIFVVSHGVERAGREIEHVRRGCGAAFGAAGPVMAGTAAAGGRAAYCYRARRNECPTPGQLVPFSRIKWAEGCTVVAAVAVWSV